MMPVPRICLDQDPPLRPLLSIICLTFNHREYVHEAIHGFLSQHTNFRFEILIHDDASDDGTDKIIIRYQEQFPDLIKAILQVENQYSIRRFGFLNDLLQLAQGKYIALCEGDDYWTANDKLQQQVDFLELNPDFAICFHSVQVLDDGELKDDFITKVPSQISSIKDLAIENFIHTCSCVFRVQDNRIGPNFSQTPLGDYYLHMMNARYGKIYHLNECMAVYRIHNSSLWSQLDWFNKLMKTLVARICILNDIGETHSSTRLIMIDGIINLMLRTRKEFPDTPPRQFQDIVRTDECVYRLIDRLETAVAENERQNQATNSIRFLLMMLLKACKRRLSF